MIKTGIVLLALIALSTCMSYFDFNKTLHDCSDKIRSCQLNFYDSPVIGDEELLCAQEVHKAQICFSRYKQCFATNSTGPEYNQEVPITPPRCPSSAGSAIWTSIPIPPITKITDPVSRATVEVNTSPYPYCSSWP